MALAVAREGLVTALVAIADSALPGASTSGFVVPSLTRSRVADRLWLYWPYARGWKSWLLAFLL